MTYVIKVGGNELDNPTFLQGLARIVKMLPALPVIVHGGGRGTTQLMERLGIEARFINGLRVTDPPTLELAIMGLVGQASAQLVQAFAREGVPALGLSGVDAALVTAVPLTDPEGDLGAVGAPVTVNVAALELLLAAGFLPCIAPICLSETGDLLNVNADSVAAAVAVALNAEKLLFITNVRAIGIGGEEVETITPAAIERAIANDDISGGMIPKARAAAAAVHAGVPSVLITDLYGLASLARGFPAGTTVQGE